MSGAPGSERPATTPASGRPPAARPLAAQRPDAGLPPDEPLPPDQRPPATVRRPTPADDIADKPVDPDSDDSDLGWDNPRAQDRDLDDWYRTNRPPHHG